jgi:hypothetical protein
MYEIEKIVGNMVSFLILTNVSEREVKSLKRKLNMAKNIGMSLKKLGEALNCQQSIVKN